MRERGEAWSSPPPIYTPAAVKLAASNQVLLLHHADLRRIDRLLARSAT